MAERETKSRFMDPKVGWKATLLTIFVWAGALFGLAQTDAGRYLSARISRPLDFHTREALGQGAKLDDRITIYSIDDSTFEKMGSWVLSVKQWAEILEAIAEKEPKAIFIDAIFSKIVDPRNEWSEAKKILEDIDVPIVVGSFVVPRQVSYREPLDLSNSDYDLGRMLGAESLGSRPGEWRLPPMVDMTDGYAYGPAPRYRPVFDHVGHILYSGDGQIAPLLRLSENRVLPHMAMFAGNDRKIRAGGLHVDDELVPVDSNGYLTVNFVTPNQLYDRSYSMIKSVIKRSRRGQSAQHVRPGDAVLIIPQMYTGNTDLKTTPFGLMPGGFVIASVINSALGGEWLRPLFAGELLIGICVIAGVFIGLRFGSVLFWGFMLSLTALSMGTNAYLFSYHHIVVPWLLPMVGFVGSSVTIFALKTRANEKRTQQLRQALEGYVAPDHLKSMLKRPDNVSFEARERVVTLMFIDVVGFSLLAENMLPRMAFENLKKLLSELGEVVHRHGGIIDKTLGDGLLCYFGYKFDDDVTIPDHAERALQCAIEIQKSNVRRNLDAAAAGDSVYPLRIGINTASCYLGDLGSENRIDFTVVGNGVNFAKRLEGACDMHGILVSSTSHDLMKGVGLPTGAITKRFIRIKHHSELVEAYDYDPIADQPQLKKAALEGFRKCANIERVDQRWPVRDPSTISLYCDFGRGELVNFSHTGLSIRLPQLLARGTRLNVHLDAANGVLKNLLAEHSIDVIRGEVRWGYPEDNGYVHGVLITNLSEKQSDDLVQYLCEFAFARQSDDYGHSGSKVG